MCKVKYLWRENRVLKIATMFFFPCGNRPQTKMLGIFIDQHRDTLWVEPICKLLQVASSGYSLYAAQQRVPKLRCIRRQTGCYASSESRLGLAGQRCKKGLGQLNFENVTVARSTLEHHKHL